MSYSIYRCCLGNTIQSTDELLNRGENVFYHNSNISEMRCLITAERRCSLVALAGVRVATDLESLEKSGNLKETPESQGICLKSQGVCDRIPKLRETSGNFVV